MTTFLQLVISGLATGSVYALVALGFVLVFKSTDVFNFAHGNLMMLGAYVAMTAITTWAMPWGVSLVVVLAAAAVLGVLIQAVLMRHVVGQPFLIPALVTVALSLIVKSVVAIVWGTQNYVYDPPLPKSVIDLAGVRIASVDLIVIGASLAVMAAFALLFRRSSLGLHMRATADNPEGALAAGVDANRVFLVAFGLAVMLAAAGGILLASTQTAVSLGFGEVGLLALPAAVIGGLASVPGAVVGGLLVGVLEKLGAGYISTESQDLVVYAVLLLMILVRPYGLLGQPAVKRV
jgi:branched-chain amino acid transport system permease protein